MKIDWEDLRYQMISNFDDNELIAYFNFHCDQMLNPVVMNKPLIYAEFKQGARISRTEIMRRSLVNSPTSEGRNRIEE